MQIYDPVLVIGGPARGMRVDVVESLSTLSVFDYDKRRDNIYYISQVAGNTKRFKVAHPQDWTGDDIIAALIEGFV